LIGLFVWSLSSRLAWEGRLTGTTVEIMLIIGVDRMATDYVDTVDTILNIDSGYVAKLLLVLAFLVIAIITFTKGISEYRAKAKEVARDKGEAMDYGFNYIIQNVTTIVLGIIATFYVSGWIIGAGIVDGSTFYDCAGLVFIISIICGLAGDAFLRTVLESSRDKAKTKDALKGIVAEQPAEQPAEPVPVLNELNKH